MKRLDELAHKITLIHAWNGRSHVHAPRWGGSVDPATARIVRAFLETERGEARRFARDLMEADHMETLWANLEGEVDRQLIDTVGLTVGPRAKETPAEYDERLRAVASQFASMGGRTVPVRLSDERLTTLTRPRARSTGRGKRRRGDARETGP